MLARQQVCLKAQRECAQIDGTLAAVERRRSIVVPSQGEQAAVIPHRLEHDGSRKRKLHGINRDHTATLGQRDRFHAVDGIGIMAVGIMVVGIMVVGGPEIPLLQTEPMLGGAVFAPGAFFGASRRPMNMADVTRMGSVVTNVKVRS